MSVLYPPYKPSIFGRMVSGGDVESWCVALAKRWMGTYMSEAERQAGIPAGTYARPRSYVRTISFDKWPEDQLPAFMLVSAGIASAPTREGDGTYSARWLMGLGLLCSARTQQESHDMALLMTEAARTLFVQKASLDGHADGTQWLDERNDDLTYDDIRSLSSGQAHFAVTVADVVSAGKGPAAPDPPLVPDTDPWADWPVVQTHDEVVVHETDPLTKEE